VKVNKAAMDYYMRLTTFHSQFRAIGVNYNQVAKAIKSTFTEKKALAFLYKLEKATIELVTINQKIIALTQEFEKKMVAKINARNMLYSALAYNQIKVDDNPRRSFLPIA
jgi:hypothetical protein